MVYISTLICHGNLIAAWIKYLENFLLSTHEVWHPFIA